VFWQHNVLLLSPAFWDVCLRMQAIAVKACDLPPATKDPCFDAAKRKFNKMHLQSASA
jgi:hypothetical protein